MRWHVPTVWRLRQLDYTHPGQVHLNSRPAGATVYSPKDALLNWRANSGLTSGCSAERCQVIGNDCRVRFAVVCYLLNGQPNAMQPRCVWIVDTSCGPLYGVPTLILDRANDATGPALRRVHEPLLRAAGQSRCVRGPLWALRCRNGMCQGMQNRSGGVPAQGHG